MATFSNTATRTPAFQIGEWLPKLGLYLRKPDAYWQLSDEQASLAVDAGPLGRYPLNLTPRLASGHFTLFDEAGLPVRIGPDKKTPLHNYTTICCFALAHWDLYLTNGDANHLEKFLRSADYVSRTAERQGQIVRLRAEKAGCGHVGEVSAIVQGEGISVLCRAWHVTHDPKYLEMAIGCAEPFVLPLCADGVVTRVTGLNVPWYEEYTTSLRFRHVLNGMVYALWGLRELAIASGSSRAKEMFDVGIESVLKALPCYDAGFWSLYALPEKGPRYVASILYHNLHICQLKALHSQTGQTEFLKQALHFEAYSRSVTCRLHAALCTAHDKLVS